MNVIKFSAEWCGPCKTMTPLFERASKQFPDIKFVDSDVEENVELADKYHIRNVPTILVVDDNDNEISRMSGSLSYMQLCSFIEKAVA
jgi:thiol-disulfide isomerase/thioredoxin